MTKEKKELLLKDLCGRLPYNPYIFVKEDNIKTLLTSMDVDEIVEIWYGGTPYSIEDVKPYLRPMSSMTEEEQQKYYGLTHQEEDDVWGKCLFDKMVDFCNENHLDYRGLIEKGLALEAPENMYKEN